MTQKCGWRSGKEGCKAWAKKGSAFCRHHPPMKVEKPEGQSLLEEIVWDALKNSRCPMSHRYEGPGKSLPCRWCRTAHAVMLVLVKMEAEGLKPLEIIAQFEEKLGWTLADPVVYGNREREDRGCSTCQRKPGEPRNSWCGLCGAR
jgi:hypothetical protein